MTKQVMHRQASDNEYLHKDFHGALSGGIEYLHQNYGPQAGEFKITMHHCPSKSRLLEFTHIEPYHDYCGHCDLLYRRVLEPLGYEYNIDFSECDQAKCKVSINRKKS